MMIVSLLIIGLAAFQATAPSPPLAMGPGPSPTKPPDAITIKDISEIEGLIIARTAGYRDNGAYRWPRIELADIRCVPMRKDKTACTYRFRAKREGAEQFGPWTERKKVFEYFFGGGWAMLNGEEWCQTIAPKKRPDSCFPTNLRF